MSEGWRQTPPAVPFCMRHRPPHIVQHMTRQLKSVFDGIPADHMTSVSDGTYSVTSSSSSRQYVVTTGVEEPSVVLPSCECYAWQKSHLPCKHRCAVLHYCHLTWDCFPAAYREHPVLSVDNGCISTAGAVWFTLLVTSKLDTSVQIFTHIAKLRSLLQLSL